MIISHKYKYLFIEIPRTGSTAISQELRRNYDGVSILRKHSDYLEFLKVATPEEKKYFVFAGIRNPLDDAVSLYFKYKTNHKMKYTNPARLATNGGSVTKANITKFSFVQNTNADFPTFFKRSYKLPYNNISSLSHQYCNFIIRFENLQEDFATALQLIGIESKGPLPQKNKTGGRAESFTAYYTPEAIAHAKKVFGPFMKKWGYEFPPEWGDSTVSPLTQLEFQVVDSVRNFCWKHVRWSPSFYGRLFRQVR
ncbi:MAG TPA: sulfotransferase family 2 domain-containing protein [Anaerolineae bacterium]|nr:sulfotransferase family 2 domain-containing protein [Anaerolineae bacterium]